GDRVWDIRLGWGKVIDYCFDKNFPITVDFGSSRKSYTTDGKDSVNDANRILLFEEIEIPVSALIRPKWRVLKGGTFWYVSAFGIATKGIDYYSICDETLYKVGNYFKTEEETEESRFYKVFHEEELN
ncbi:MAG: hypothetical protein ACRC6E_12470, partial [Fusobacteriaceae bacterium]